MVFTRYMTQFIPVHHGFEFEVEKSWVWDLSKFLSVTQDGEQWFVVDTEQEISEAKYEESAFVQPCDGSKGFSFYGVVSGFCWGAEPTPTIDGLPS